MRMFKLIFGCQGLISVLTEGGEKNITANSDEGNLALVKFLNTFLSPLNTAA